MFYAIGFWILVLVVVILILWRYGGFILGLGVLILASIYLAIDEKIESTKKQRVISLIKKMQKSSEIYSLEKVFLILKKLNYDNDLKCVYCESIDGCQKCKDKIFIKIYEAVDAMLYMSPKNDKEALFDKFSLLKTYATDYAKITA